MITESTPALMHHSHILLMKLTLITATMATDLSAAFDTIDNVKLINKLHFYGIERNELEMFRSFLSESTQYVQIDTFKSESLIVHHVQSYKDLNLVRYCTLSTPMKYHCNII